MDTRETVGSARLTELDSLRGIAALMVLLFHYTFKYQQDFGHQGEPLAYIWWGQYGVQLFFGISGFVIFWTLRRTVKPMDFVVSRLSRLYPAYWTAIFLTTIAVSLGELPSLHVAWWIPIANLTMAQGLFRVPDVDGVYWTLLVELCFYGCMLLIFLARAFRWIELILCLWIASSWIWYLHPEFSYTLGALAVQKYIPHFALGIIAYRLYDKEASMLQAAPVFIIGLITVAIRQPLGTTVMYLVVSAVFSLLILGQLRLLRGKLFIWLGGISYSIYLIHENIGWITIHVAEHRLGLNPNLAILLATALTLTLAWFVRNFVELPSMRWIRGWYKSKQVHGG